MKNLLMLVCFVAVCQSAIAQDSLGVKRYRYQFSFYGGPQFINADRLNDALVSHGIGKLSRQAILLGTESTFFWDHFGAGVSLEALTMKRNESSNLQATLNGYTSGVYASYIILERSSFTIYPTIGLRIARMNVKTKETPSAHSIDDILSQPHRDATISYVNEMIDLGVNFSLGSRVKNRPWNSPQTDRYIFMTAKVGYNILVSKDKGEYNDVALSSGPSLNYGGPYFRIGIGFESRSRRINWK